ncbi:hypothetical protein EC991_010946 [Linnemannia zychae]|nr:hypothetical protein EC991_010946 [Linnemannia zychae]
MSDSDDSKPVQKKPQPRPRSKRSKVLHSPSSATSQASPNSTLSSPQAGAGTTKLADNYSERVEDDFFNRSSVSLQQIHRMQETRLHEEMTHQDEELEIMDLKAPKDDVLPILDFEEEDMIKKKSKGAAQKREHGQETKRKRELSLTPPPDLPSRRLPVHAPVTVKPANTSVTAIDLDVDDDDEDDYEKTKELDPELASIAAKLNSIASQQSMEAAMNRHPLLVVPPEYEEAMRLHERPVQVTVRSSNMFREVMTFYCRQKNINYANTVFTYSGVRLMPSSTPAALDFPTRAIIEAYDQEAHRYIKDQENLERSRRLAEMERQAAETAAASQDNSSHGAGDGGQQDSNHDGEDDGSAEYIFIKLRGKDTSDEKIRVKKTTTVNAIISHYKSIKRIPASTTVKLEFDDEALDLTTVIGDTEVEDDDMLVVRVG